MRETETHWLQKTNRGKPKIRERKIRALHNLLKMYGLSYLHAPPRFKRSTSTTHSLLITKYFSSCRYFFSTWPSHPKPIPSILCPMDLKKYLGLQGLSPYYLLDWACLTHIPRPCSILPHFPLLPTPTTSSTFRFFLFFNVINYPPKTKTKKKINLLNVQKKYLI